MLPEKASSVDRPQPIKKLSDVHLQMVDYLTTHPGCTLEELNAYLGGRYTIGWLSQIINSDAFQERLSEARVEIFGDTKMTIKDRVNSLAHMTLKRLEERIPVETDVNRLTNAADLVLKSLGYGQPKAPAAAPGTVNNTLIVGSVDKETLENARSLMHKSAEQPAEKVLNPLPALPDVKE